MEQRGWGKSSRNTVSATQPIELWYLKVACRKAGIDDGESEQSTLLLFLFALIQSIVDTNPADIEWHPVGQNRIYRAPISFA